MGAGFGLFQIVARAADNHFAPVVHKARKGRFEVQQLGAVVHHGQHVDAKARFQRCELVQGVDHNVGNGAALEVNDHAYALAVRFVAQVGDAVNLAVVDQSRDFFHQRAFVEPKGNLADNNALRALFAVFNLYAPAHLNRAAPGMVGIVQAFARVNIPSGGKVRAFHIVHEVVNTALRVVEQELQGIAQFAQVVGRNIGGHTHGNTRAAVEQQVGNLARHDRGFLKGIIVVGAKIYGVLVQIVQKLLGKLGHAHFGVTHGSSGVAVNGTKVALPVHQRIAHGKFLRHAHQRIVHGRVAVRVIFTDNVTDDTGGFFVRTVVVVGKLVLRKKNTPVYWL